MLLVVLGALASAFLYSMNADFRSVVVMAGDVRHGDMIESTDLALVDVPGSFGIDTLPAAELGSLVGLTALSDLPKGSFPLPGHFGSDPLPNGESLVGLKLPAGRLPASGLFVGVPVRLIATGEEPVPPVDGIVAALPRELQDGTHVVDVRVSVEFAEPLARLAANDLVALVLLGDS